MADPVLRLVGVRTSFPEVLEARPVGDLDMEQNQRSTDHCYSIPNSQKAREGYVDSLGLTKHCRLSFATHAGLLHFSTLWDLSSSAA
jgi:hypothetical protein